MKHTKKIRKYLDNPVYLQNAVRKYGNYIRRTYGEWSDIEGQSPRSTSNQIHILRRW